MTNMGSSESQLEEMGWQSESTEHYTTDLDTKRVFLNVNTNWTACEFQIKFYHFRYSVSNLVEIPRP